MKKEIIVHDAPVQPAPQAATPPKKARAAKTGSKAAVAPKKAAAAKKGTKAAPAAKKAAPAKSTKTGKFQIFDSPLQPRHFSVARLQQVAKRS